MTPSGTSERCLERRPVSGLQSGTDSFFLQCIGLVLILELSPQIRVCNNPTVKR